MNDALQNIIDGVFRAPTADFPRERQIGKDRVSVSGPLPTSDHKQVHSVRACRVTGTVATHF